MKTIKLSNAEIRVEEGSLVSKGLKCNDLDDTEEYNSAIDGVESLLLALHENGVDIGTKKFKESIEVAVESITNHFS